MPEFVWICIYVFVVACLACWVSWKMYKLHRWIAILCQLVADLILEPNIHTREKLADEAYREAVELGVWKPD